MKTRKRIERSTQGSKGNTGPGPLSFEAGDPNMRTGPGDADEVIPPEDGYRLPDAAKAYLREIVENIPTLSPERETELAKRIAQGDWAARNELVQANLRLVVQYAARWASPGLPVQDLIHEGCLGLIKATERFDHTRGNRFSTYAQHWVKQSIRRAYDEKSRIIRLPAHTRELDSRLKAVASQLAQTLGREPTVRETAAAAGLSERRAENIRRYMDGPLSLDAPVGPESDADLWEYIPCGEEDPFQLVNISMLRERIQKLLDRLDPRERQVLALRYGLWDGAPCTPEEIGRAIGIPRDQVRRIEEKALRKLRQPANLTLIYDYRWSS